MVKSFLEYFKEDTTLEYHDQLNPKLFTPNGKLMEDVREKLLEFSKKWVEFTEIIPKNIIKDVYMVGGNVNYNYTDMSDIDVHTVIDESGIKDRELFDKILLDKKAMWTAKHPHIRVKGYPLEPYAQNVGENMPEGQGIYSLIQDKWIKKPENKHLDLKHDEKVKEKADVYEKAIQHLIDTGASNEKLDEVLNRIKLGRGEDIQKHGEFAFENLVFKELRNRGVFDRASDYKVDQTDKELSLEHRLSFKNFISESETIQQKMARQRAAREARDGTQEEQEAAKRKKAGEKAVANIEHSMKRMVKLANKLSVMHKIKESSERDFSDKNWFERHPTHKGKHHWDKLYPNDDLHSAHKQELKKRGLEGNQGPYSSDHNGKFDFEKTYLDDGGEFHSYKKDGKIEHHHIKANEVKTKLTGPKDTLKESLSDNLKHILHVSNKHTKILSDKGWYNVKGTYKGRSIWKHPKNEGHIISIDHSGSWLHHNVDKPIAFGNSKELPNYLSKNLKEAIDTIQLDEAMSKKRAAKYASEKFHGGKEAGRGAASIANSAFKKREYHEDEHGNRIRKWGEHEYVTDNDVKHWLKGHRVIEDLKSGLEHVRPEYIHNMIKNGHLKKDPHADYHWITKEGAERYKLEPVMGKKFPKHKDIPDAPKKDEPKKVETGPVKATSQHAHFIHAMAQSKATKHKEPVLVLTDPNGNHTTYRKSVWDSMSGKAKARYKHVQTYHNK